MSSDQRKLRAGYVVMPFCVLARVEECVELLRAAGVTGSVEIVRVTPEQADLDSPAGRVTNTDPPADSLLAPGAPVTIYVNPGEVAELTEHDRGRIARLQAQVAQARAAKEQIFDDSLAPKPNRAERPPITATLDTALLERLDDRLREGGALIAGAWAPGLTDEQIDELLLPVGITLPEEARVWWRWHNGTRPDAPQAAHSLAWREVLSLEYAVESYEMFRALNVELYGLDGLLSPLGERPIIYFDCTGPIEEPVAVYADNLDDEPEIALGSIGDLVLAMLEYFDRGVWTIAPDGAIVGDPDKRPPAIAFL